MPGLSETGCLYEQYQTIERVLQAQGYGPLSKFLKEPRRHTPLSAYPYAPGYLDMLEQWLTVLPG